MATKGSGWVLSPRYSFQAGDDGAYPQARVIIDQSGNMYGTTLAGGCGRCTSGCGTVYELSPSQIGACQNEPIPIESRPECLPECTRFSPATSQRLRIRLPEVPLAPAYAVQLGAGLFRWLCPRQPEDGIVDCGREWLGVETELRPNVAPLESGSQLPSQKWCSPRRSHHRYAAQRSGDVGGHARFHEAGRSRHSGGDFAYPRRS